MNVLRLLAASLLVIGLTSVAMAEEKKVEISKEKLVGTWEVVKSEGSAPPVGGVLELLKDGKATFISKGEGEKAKKEGTYTLDGDKISIGDKSRKETMTVKSLTDTEMVFADEKGNKAEFKKKK